MTLLFISPIAIMLLISFGAIIFSFIAFNESPRRNDGFPDDEYDYQSRYTSHYRQPHRQRQHQYPTIYQPPYQYQYPQQQYWQMPPPMPQYPYDMQPRHSNNLMVGIVIFAIIMFGMFLFGNFGNASNQANTGTSNETLQKQIDELKKNQEWDRADPSGKRHTPQLQKYPTNTEERASDYDDIRPEKNFTLRIGSFEDEKNARNLEAELKTRFSMPVWIEEAENDLYQVVYRVFIGEFGTAKAAMNFGRRQGFQKSFPVELITE